MRSKRLRIALCALRGHLPPQNVAGERDGHFIRASICPRCHHIFASEVGSRKLRRSRWRDRGMA